MMHRRQFLNRTTAALAAATIPCRASSEANARSFGSKKRGLGLSMKSPGWKEKLTALHCRWFYSWSGLIPPDLPTGLEYIPMVYRYAGDRGPITTTAEAAKASGIKELLGFNEPDAAKQGNMTVEQALDAWPILMETGMRLGSPGCVHPDNDWMKRFMEAASRRGLKVDFVCVHSYGGPNAAALAKRLESIHKMYGRPLWITEFAVGDWQAKSAAENRHKPEVVLRFMEEALPMLDKLDFLERYAWFPSKPTSIPLGTSALHDEHGALTRLGECYRDS